MNLTNTGNLELRSSVADADHLTIAPNNSGAGSFTGTLTSEDLTADRTWTLPNKSGTVAMLDDISGGPSGENYWQINDKVMSPYNTTLDLAVGGTATSSAKFLVEGLTGETFINANSLTDGFGLSMISTSNALTSGGLAQFLWNPTAPTTATGDLFVIDVNGNATVNGALFAVEITVQISLPFPRPGLLPMPPMPLPQPGM
jgi:hypothetical protein